MIRYLSQVLYILADKRHRLILLLFSFLVVSVLEAFGIGLIGPFILAANNPKIVHQYQFLEQAYTYIGLESEARFIAIIGIFIVLVFCIKSWISWRIQARVFVFSYELQGDLSSKLLHAYLHAPYTFYLSKNSSHVIHNIVGETKIFSNSVLIPLLTSAANIIVVLSLTILLCLTNLAAVIVILGIFFPLFLLFGYFKNQISQWGKDLSQSNQAMIRVINHGLGGIKETRVIGCESYFEEQLAQQANIYAQASGAFYGFKILPRIMIETLLVMFLVGFTSVFLILGQNIQQLIAVLGIFTLASVRLIPAASNAMSSISTLQNSRFTLSKLFHDLKELELQNTPENRLRETSLNLVRCSTTVPEVKEITFAKEITLNDVSYCYPGATEPAIQELSLTLQKGKSIAFIGKSGAGKTTLVDVILGLLTPQKGDIQVDGKSIYDNLRAWQNIIGYIPQNIFLIDDTIERNIAFGVPDDLIDCQRLQRAIQAAQLLEVVDGLPQGIKTPVGERGVLLSGGQRQRVGIARALYHEREILVLDEATAALDNETESLVTDAIKSLSGMKTIIIIAHRLTTVEHCDYVYLLDKGQIIRAGSYQQVVLGELAHQPPS